VKAGRFSYRRVETAAELTAELAAYGTDAQVLAGGQSLMPMLNMRVARPAVLLDINAVSEFAGARQTDDGFELGSLTRHRTLLDDAAIGRAVPLLALVAPAIAHPAVRNRGTIGGSVALADPAAELPAVCICLDADIRIVSQQGSRWCASSDFILGPMQTALPDDAAIAGFRFPAPTAGQGFAFREISRRHGDYATAGVVGRGTLTGGVFRELKLCLFGATGRPTVVNKAGDLLRADITAPLEEIKRAVTDEVEIVDSALEPSGHRLHLAAVLLRRVAADLKGREDNDSRS
jgi:carbon-monoxide dehydrogenase medium subunit